MGSDHLYSILIPVYRSEAYLAATVRELLAFFEQRSPVEVILVNDGSPDGVQRVIDDLCAGDPRVRGLSLDKNLGQHRATLLGLRETRGDVVVTIDDDAQNPPSAALAVAETLEREGLDVVYGTFQPSGQSWSRRAATAVNLWVSKRTLPNKRAITLTNVRGLRGDFARKLASIDAPNPYIEAMIFRMTNRIGEAPVDHRPRASGKSGYTLCKLLALSYAHLTTTRTNQGGDT